ncbi:MAG: ion transporter [Acidobacteriota bacterium]
MVAVILINTAAMTAAGFFDDGSPTRLGLDAIDYVCVLFFVIEAILKIRRWGWHEYRVSMWNRFDLIITLLCLPVLVEPFAHEAHYPTWLPVFRAGRLFRLFRLLRFIPDADGLARGIGRSLKASVGVFLALALINLIFALAANMIFGDVVPEHFGDPLRSLYSIFQIFTLEGWNEYPSVVAERAGAGWALGARIFFIAAVLIGGVLGISLANAVFIDEMTLDNTRVLEEKVETLGEEVRQLRLLLQGTVLHDLPPEPASSSGEASAGATSEASSGEPPP